MRAAVVAWRAIERGAAGADRVGARAWVVMAFLGVEGVGRDRSAGLSVAGSVDATNDPAPDRHGAVGSFDLVPGDHARRAPGWPATYQSDARRHPDPRAGDPG